MRQASHFDSVSPNIIHMLFNLGFLSPLSSVLVLAVIGSGRETLVESSFS